MSYGFGFSTSRQYRPVGGSPGGGGGGGGSGYTAGGVQFDDVIHLSTPALTVVDSPSVVASFWVNIFDLYTRNRAVFFASDPTDSYQNWAAPYGGGPDDGKFISAFGDVPGAIFQWGEAPIMTYDGWHHYLIAYHGDGASSPKNKLRIYRDRVEVDAVNRQSDFGVTPTLNGYAFYVGSDNGSGVSYLEMADFWFDVGHNFIENDGTVSSATLDKFIDSSFKPVDLGSTGQLPTGSTPAVYMHRDAADGAEVFLNNRGTGGVFTAAATPSLSGTNPSD